MTEMVLFCRENGIFSHYPFEDAAPESFHGRSDIHTDRWGVTYTRHVRSPVRMPIQFNRMLVRADALPGMKACVERMRTRQDLTSIRVHLTLARANLTRTEQMLTKLSPVDLPPEIVTPVWLVAPTGRLADLQEMLIEEPMMLPEMLRKAMFLRAWIDGGGPIRRLKEQPDWMELRGAILTQDDALLVHGFDMLQACEEMVRKYPLTSKPATPLKASA